MLKRSIAAIRGKLFSGQAGQDQQSSPSNDANVTRRSFFKRAAIGAVAITGTAGAAKAVIDSVPKSNLQERYTKDGLTGEEDLKSREYVLMSEQEKKEMLDSFIKGHSVRT